jgi:hypothetical protein
MIMKTSCMLQFFKFNYLISVKDFQSLQINMYIGIYIYVRYIYMHIEKVYSISNLKLFFSYIYEFSFYIKIS